MKEDFFKPFFSAFNSLSAYLFLTFSLCLLCSWSAVLTQGHLLSRVKMDTNALSADSQMCERTHTFKVLLWICVLVCQWMVLLKLIRVERDVCEFVCVTMFGQRGGAFFLHPVLGVTLQGGAGGLGWPPPNEQIWSCQGKNSCIHWMTLIFSHFTQVQRTKQAEESWGRHFLRLRRQWQTCGNYLKSKQTPRKQPFLCSFVTAFF